MSDTHYITFHFKKGRENIVREVIGGCMEAGFTTTQNGRTEQCKTYRKNSGKVENKEGIDLQTAIEDISTNMPGKMQLWHESSLSVYSTFDCDPKSNPKTIRAHPEVEDCIVHIRTFKRQLSRVSEGDDLVRKRLDALIELTARVTEAADPDYVWYGFNIGDIGPYRDRIPTERPVPENIDDIGWLTVFNPEAVAQLGGEERVLDAPAWRTELLDTGHILVVISDHPLDPTETPAESPCEYLLDSNN